MKKKISSYEIEAIPYEGRFWLVSVVRQSGEMEYYFERKLPYIAALRLYHSIRTVTDVKRISGKNWSRYH